MENNSAGISALPRESYRQCRQCGCHILLIRFYPSRVKKRDWICPECSVKNKRVERFRQRQIRLGLISKDPEIKQLKFEGI